MAKIDQLQSRIRALKTALKEEKKRALEEEKKARLDALILASQNVGLLKKTPDEIRHIIEKTMQNEGDKHEIA